MVLTNHQKIFHEEKTSLQSLCIVYLIKTINLQKRQSIVFDVKKKTIMFKEIFLIINKNVHLFACNLSNTPPIIFL